MNYQLLDKRDQLMNYENRLNALREVMSAKGLAAFIVPSSDPHQSEYVAPHWNARTWISGFNGSAGTVIITQDAAALWTDSRYFLQAEQQLDSSCFQLMKMGLPETPDFVQWLAQKLKAGDRVGYDPVVNGKQFILGLTVKLHDFQILTVALDEDPFESIWVGRPTIPQEAVMELPLHFSGESRIQKFRRIRKEMKSKNVDIHLVASLDDIAWILNIRGKDIQFNPVVISYLIIEIQKIKLFINKQKLSSEMILLLQEDDVEIAPYEDIWVYANRLNKSQTVYLDPERVNLKLAESIKSCANIVEGMNFSTLMKAMKNEYELKGIRKAHIRDGVAMVKWMIWLEKDLQTHSHNEVSIADKLEEFRSRQENFRGLSFNAISGFGANGAIVHYSPQRATAARIETNGVLLIDSGGQYLDGTTDITRTIGIGLVEDEVKEWFTRVLQGHIRLAMAVFPEGTTGSQLDSFARAALWKAGYNYGHGTGHGVGHFLAVHEGPQNISPRGSAVLMPGMLISNEPGMYRAGKYGIRIENLIVVTPVMTTEFGEYFGFETVTLCPIDLNMVNRNMMSDEEINWLNNYHKIVYEKLSPGLTSLENDWLRNKTCKI